MTSDENLVKLLADAKNFTSEEELNRWKESFLVQYKNYLNAAGVENAQASNGRLVRSLEKLAKTVITVNAFVKEGKISKENQSVQGQRHLTNMTEQMASSEKEIARFMPTTGADEEEVGYDKFELGAVLIEDGFHVYEYMKSTKDIIEELQEIVLTDILSTNKLSIVQFYLRQIQTFCDVMADLGLFGLMETVLEIYKVKPRTKAKLVKNESLPANLDDIDYEGEEPLKPERVLDPNKKYKFRAAYTGGYTDPLSGTQPGRDEFEDPDEDTTDHPEGQGDDDDNHFVIFFDMKTGAIGKIPRKECKSNNIFFSENDKGEEQILGEVADQGEKDQLVWDLKKAMKGNAPATPKQGPKRTSSGKSNALREIKPPFEVSKKAPTRSRSGKSDGVERSTSLVEASARKELMKTRSGGLLDLRASTLRANEGSARDEKTFRRDHVMHHSNPSTNVASKQRRPGSVHESSTNVEAEPNAAPVRRASTPLTAPSPSADGWSKPAAIAAKPNAAPVRRASTPLAAPSPSEDGWAKPAAIAATRRTHKQQPVTNQAPSATGWSNPSTLAARRRDGINSS